MARYRGAILSVSMLALALAGCNKSAPDVSATTAAGGLPPLPAALPMQPGPASQLVTAPPVAALPVTRYVNVSRPARAHDSYAYLDRASDVQDEIGDAPPDYAYDNDDGVSPWAWETRDGDYRYAEPASDGIRDYYYQQGAEYPYLVRTRDRSYAYAGGALVAIYLLSGALVPPDQYDGYRGEASRYYWRGEQLRRAAQQRQHQGVIAANWAAQRQRFGAEQTRWAQARSQQPDWQAYHAQNDPSQQPGWQQERQQRQQVAQQFAGWQSHGLTNAPPAVLAAAGARAAAISPGGGTPRFAGPMQPQRRDVPLAQRIAPVAGAALAGPATNGGAQAAAIRDQQLREQQLSAQRAAEHQALASQQQLLASRRLAQEAGRAQQEAAAQRQAAAAHQQQLVARSQAEQQMLASQRAEQAAGRARDLVVAHQASAAREQQALASQRVEQAASRAREMAAAQQRASTAREQLVARQVAQQQALTNQRAEQAAGRAREMAAAQEQATNARRLQAVAAQEQGAAQRRAEVARAQAPHPALAHPAPGHENDRHEQ